MTKLYTDPSLPTKKWTIYIPRKQYVDMKVHATENDENLHANVSESLAIYIRLFPHLKKLRREADDKGLSIEDYIESIIGQRQL